MTMDDCLAEQDDVSALRAPSSNGPPKPACKPSDDREETMKVLRRLLDETIVGAVVYAIICRLSPDGRPLSRDGRPPSRDGHQLSRDGHQLSPAGHQSREKAGTTR
jgi:hypothetical protein